MTDGSGEATSLSHKEILSIIFGLLLAMLLAALDQTIVATAMPTIGRDLHDLEHLPWIVTAYLLASTAVTPRCARHTSAMRTANVSNRSTGSPATIRSTCRATVP